MQLIKIFENDDFVVDYDRDRGMYRVSVFKDNHFQDEHWFDAYEEKECKHIPMKVRKEQYFYGINTYCPACNKPLESWFNSMSRDNYCHACGQALDWSED